MKMKKARSLYFPQADRDSVYQKSITHHYTNLKERLLHRNDHDEEVIDQKYTVFGLKDGCLDTEEDKQKQGLIQWQKMNRIKTFTPQSRILLCWNIVVQMAIVYTLLMVPIAIFFTDLVYTFETQQTGGFAVSITFMVILYLDIVVRFNTSFTRKSKVITDRQQIFFRYIKLPFWIDLITNISLTIYLFGNNYEPLRFVRLIFYLRVYSLLLIDYSILQCLSITRRLLAIYRFARMIILLWILMTWAACVFFAIDHSYYQEQGFYYDLDQLWLLSSQAVPNISLINAFPWYVWYQYALYWSVQTSSTIGYGDLTSRNPQEIIYNNFIMLLTTVLFAYFLNAVWEVINDLNTGPVEYTDEWQNLTAYMKTLTLPFKTKVKIVHYIEGVLKKNGEEEVESLIVENVSKELRDQFYITTRLKFFKKDYYFSSLMKYTGNHHSFWKDLAYQVQQCSFGEEDIIYGRQQFDPTLYFIKKGFVKLELLGSELSKTIKSNQTFGTEQFFSKTFRHQTAESISFVSTWRIDYVSMKNCMKKYPQIYLQFCEFSDLFIIEKSDPQINILKCWNCSQQNHFVQKCPLICYLKNDLTLNFMELIPETNSKTQRHKYSRTEKKYKKIRGLHLYENEGFNIDQVYSYTHYFSHFNMEKNTYS